MSSRLTMSRRLGTAARWPLGMLLTSWRYLWRTAPMSRTERQSELGAIAPPALPPDLEPDGVQSLSDGVGPVFRRRYLVRIEQAKLSPADLVSAMREDIDSFAPWGLARFQKVVEDGPLRPGDEYVVRMPGPWDGPVRVVDASSTAFRLVTLTGHLEAGQIEFRATAVEAALRFEIESWARSADRLSDLLYNRVLMAKEVQLHMWVSFIERVVDASGGRRAGCIEIDTRRADAPVPG